VTGIDLDPVVLGLEPAVRTGDPAG